MSQAGAVLQPALHVGLHRHGRRYPKANLAAVARHALSAGVSTGAGHCNSSGRVATRRTGCYATAVDEAWQALRAAVLGIGTANPANYVPQDEYADWYFRVTKNEHLAKLKAKMKKICYNWGIKKRCFHHTADTFLDHPELAGHALPSLDSRQTILAPAMTELAAAAAARAILEWGRPASDVTHLVLATYSGAHMPGADLRLASLLGLRRSTQRTMMYLGGCTAGSAALRIARDVAENNPTARVLVVCAELSLILFRAPCVDDPATLVMQALFGDGGVERPMFEVVSASQTVIPGSEDATAGHLGEGGLAFCPSPRMPNPVRQHVEGCLFDAVSPLGLGGGGWIDLFCAVHPGGPTILDGVEAELALAPGKLAASRRVLSEYGNMSGASMIFVLDELWRRHREERWEVGGDAWSRAGYLCRDDGAALDEWHGEEVKQRIFEGKVQFSGSNYYLGTRVKLEKDKDRIYKFLEMHRKIEDSETHD